MDIATILGLGLALSLLFMGIVVDFSTFTLKLGNIQFFIDAPSILIVIGGTFGAVLSSYPIAKVVRVGGVIAKAFRQSPEELIETLTLVIDVSKIARKNILAIEDALPSIDNLFLRNGLRLVVDRVDRELVIDILLSEMRYLELRRDEDIQILRTFASLAPAFGLIGTLIGLILLLQNLTDPAAIGPAMAIAIITTRCERVSRREIIRGKMIAPPTSRNSGSPVLSQPIGSGFNIRPPFRLPIFGRVTPPGQFCVPH